MNYMVVIQATDQLRFTLKIELPSKTAKPIKTAPAPDAAARAPAVAGTKNWPNRLPINRAETHTGHCINDHPGTVILGELLLPGERCVAPERLEKRHEIRTLEPFGNFVTECNRIISRPAG